MVRLATLVVVIAWFVACGSSSAHPEPVQPVALPELRATGAASSAATVPLASTAVGSPAPQPSVLPKREQPAASDPRVADGLAHLGSACGAAPPAGIAAFCGHSKKVAAIHWTDRSHAGADLMPKSGARFVSRRNGAMSRAYAITIAHRRAWMTESCIPCRLPSVDYDVVAYEDATDDQLARLQDRVGLPKSPALRTEAAWLKALGDAGSVERQ